MCIYEYTWNMYMSFICMYVCLNECMHMYVCNMYACMYSCMDVWLVYTQVLMPAWIGLYLHSCLCMCVRIMYTVGLRVYTQALCMRIRMYDFTNVFMYINTAYSDIRAYVWRCLRRLRIQCTRTYTYAFVYVCCFTCMQCLASGCLFSAFQRSRRPHNKIIW